MTHRDETQGGGGPREIVVAVVAEWLPSFAPPVGGNGFAKPYADRLKLSLRVETNETLASVRRRVIDELKPVATGPEGYADADPYDAIHWCMFYEPRDDDGLDSVGRYDRAQDLIVIDESGQAHWNLEAEAIATATSSAPVISDPLKAIHGARTWCCCIRRGTMGSKRSGRSSLLAGQSLDSYSPLAKVSASGEQQRKRRGAG
jgi:hypothetical protein